MSAVKEGSGWSFTCGCGWLTWNERRVRTDVDMLAHRKKCDGTPPKPKHLPAPKLRAKTDWTGREDSTWIDKL